MHSSVKSTGIGKPREMSEKSDPRVITWDWRESIDIGELSEILKGFGLSVFEIDTGTDAFAIVIGFVGTTQEEALSIYEGGYER